MGKKKESWELEIERKEAESRKWQGHWRTYQRVCSYSMEREAAVQALEVEGRIMDPLPNLERIRDAADAQVAGDRGWYSPDMIASGYEVRRKEELVAEVIAEIARWRDMAVEYLRIRNGCETVDEWITRNCRASEDL
jgi:hypothetical protein